jgi:murein L,D-transpeptidase YafK
MKSLFKKFVTATCVCMLYTVCNAQGAYVEPKKTVTKIAGVPSTVEDSLRKQFEDKKLVWPPQEMFVRSFKFDKMLEVWVKATAKEPYKLFKTYKVCMQSGTTGPKRMQGDYQVPEGFYYINEFRPHSNYHLALGLNYPNASDRILSDSTRPGFDIYIHGNCVSTGCIAINDKQIEEVYALATHAKNSGQEFIPVHIYPAKFNVRKSNDYMAQTIKAKPQLAEFSAKMKEAFYYFEEKKQLPLIMVNKKGEYLLY